MGSHLGPVTVLVLVLVKCVFCGNFYVCSDKCVSIVVKTKCVNSDNMSDICDKLNFTTNYRKFTATNTNFIKTHTSYNV